MQVGFFCSVVVDFCCCCLPPLRGGRIFLIWMGGTKTSVKVLGKKDTWGQQTVLIGLFQIIKIKPSRMQIASKILIY